MNEDYIQLRYISVQIKKTVLKPYSVLKQGFHTKSTKITRKIKDGAKHCTKMKFQ